MTSLAPLLQRAVAVVATAVALATATAALAALPAPAVAAAGQPPGANFYVTVSGSQTTTWEEPRHYVLWDCAHKWWTHGSGTETVTFQTRRTKVRLNRIARFNIFQYGTFRFGGAGANAIDAVGHVSRRSLREDGAEPNTCGGGSPTVKAGPYDCGPRSRDFDVSLGWEARNELEVIVAPSELTRLDDAHSGYAACPITVGEGAVDDGITAVSSHIPVSELMDRSLGKIILLGRKTFRYRTKPGALRFGGVLSARTRVSWTVTFTRVR